MGIGYSFNLYLLSLPRPITGQILASRTSYRDFTDYYKRFKHANAMNNYSYRKRKAPLHFFFYYKGKAI
jgi:hypothetical protein